MKKTIWIFALVIIFGSITVARADDSQEIPLAFFPALLSATGYDPIPNLLLQVDTSELLDRVADLTTEYGPRHISYNQVYQDSACNLSSETHNNNNLVRAGNYVKGEFEGYGYSAVKEAVPGEGGAFNVIAEKTGALYPQTVIEVAAHLDTQTHTPGGGDNASGVAGVLELARLLRYYPNHYTWRFITYVGEEYGMTGSKYHLKQVINRGEQVKAGLVMDGIGWSESDPQQMNCLWDGGDSENRRIAELFDFVRQEYGIDIGWRRCKPSSPYYYSDNVAYWEQGQPAVLSVGGLPYNDPHYHKCSDTWQKVDLENVQKTAQENLAVLLILDGEDLPGGAAITIQPWVVPAGAEGH